MTEPTLVHLEEHTDIRGSLTEIYRLGSSMFGMNQVTQVNLSISKADVIRGIHYSLRRQAKLVTCVSGEILDVAVDLRKGSPGFGTHSVFKLTEGCNYSLYIPPGYGHAFQALELSTVAYLLSSTHNPDAEYSVNPFDPALNIPWEKPYMRVQDFLLSDRDLSAPFLLEAIRLGILPEYSDE